MLVVDESEECEVSTMIFVISIIILQYPEKFKDFSIVIFLING